MNALRFSRIGAYRTWEIAYTDKQFPISIKFHGYTYSGSFNPVRGGLFEGKNTPTEQAPWL